MPATSAIPGWPSITCQAGFTPAQPGMPGMFQLDDPVRGVLNTDLLSAGTISASWTDISAWVRSGQVSRPCNRQQGPLYSYPAGTMSVVLNNADGRFDPANLSGPYVSGGQTQLAPAVPVQFTASWQGVSYPLFSGFTDSWDDDGTNRGPRYTQVTLAATDAQKIFNGITLPAAGAGVGAGESTGARISRILGAAGWYPGIPQQKIDAGTVTVQATTFGAPAWQLMQVTADTEAGALFIDGAGTVTFRQRTAIITSTRSAQVQAIFGDSPGTAHPGVCPQAPYELPYAVLPRARDDTIMANDIQATRVNGVLQEATDDVSIAKYLFPRSYARSDLIMQADTAAMSWAQWVLNFSKDGEDRFDTITVNPARDPADLWPVVLGLQNGDRVQVWRRPPGEASPVVKNVFIRGIAHAFDVSAGTWQTTFTCQDAAKYVPFLRLDDGTYGQLDASALS